MTASRIIREDAPSWSGPSSAGRGRVMHTVVSTWEEAAGNRGLWGAMTEFFAVNLTPYTDVEETAVARVSRQVDGD